MPSAQTRAGFSVEGDKALMRALRTLGKPSRVRKVTRKSLNKASTPINKEAKRRAPRDTGLLRKSIGKISRTYRPHGVLVVIGPRSRFESIRDDGSRHVPVNIAHLVEFGHGGPHPAQPRPFLRPAYDSKHEEARAIFRDAMWDNYKKEFRRLLKKGKI